MIAGVSVIANEFALLVGECLAFRAIFFDVSFGIAVNHFSYW
jgi:hypothetical protein